MEILDLLKQDLADMKRHLHNYEAGEDEVGHGIYRARIAETKIAIKCTEKRIALIIKTANLK